MAGDREMNLTDDEASALGYGAQRRLPNHRERRVPEDLPEWLGHGDERRPWRYRGRQVRGEPAAVLGIPVVIGLIVVILFGLSYHGPLPEGAAQNAEQQDQSSAGNRAEVPSAAQASSSPSPDSAIEAPSEPKPEYLPAGWDWAYSVQDDQLFDARDVQIGVVPKGTRYFYASTGTQLGQIVVAEDGSFWGYNHVQAPPPLQRTLELRPEWRKGVAIVQALTTGGYVQQLPPQCDRSSSTESESTLPQGYGYGCVGMMPGDNGQGQWLVSISVGDGTAYQTAFIRNGTCLVVDESPTAYGYRKVASVDGEYRGYTWFPGTRHPGMTPEMKCTVEIIEQIQ